MEAFGRRRLFAGVAGAAVMGLFGQARAVSPRPASLQLAPALPSLLLVRAVTGGALPDLRLEVWRSPDVLRAGIVAGDVRAFSTPSSIPANLYNRGAPLRLVSITGMGHMTLVTADDTIGSLADIEGRTVQLFFKNEMPDLVFRYLMGRLGMEAGRDYRVEYAASATEVTRLLVAGKAKTALLAEPNTTMTLSMGPFRRAVDIQRAWGEITGLPPRIPVSGIAVTEDVADDHPAFVRSLHAATMDALAWISSHQGEAGALAESTLGIKADVAAASLSHFNMDAVPARSIRPELERFWTALAEISPGVIGGKLPDERFYFPLGERPA